MKKFLSLALVPLFAAAVMADDARPVESEGSVTIGAEQVDVDSESAKYNEYRDRKDGLLLDRIWFDRFDPAAKTYFEFEINRIDRQDTDSWLRAGRFGRWSLDLDWNQTPHLLSNHARTPLIYTGNGRYEAASNIPILFKKLATGSADTPGVLGSDALVAAYLAGTLRGTALGTQRDRGSMSLAFGGAGPWKFALDLTDDRRDGSKISYGPIGDRPPRTLNIQFPEPVEYRTRDLSLQFGHEGESRQIGFKYLVSEFENQIDTLTWENVWATPAAGATFDVWDRAVGAYGRRSLSPDNRLHQATLDFSSGAPWRGRFSAVVSYGRLEQNERLLPYAYSEGLLVDPALPRNTARAEMETQFAHLNYTANPTGAFSLRAFLRYYALDNRTPESNWWYVTSDTPNLTGTRSFKNQRTNLAYAYDTSSAGAEAQWRLRPWRSTVIARLEREEVSREYREADTAENRLDLRWRARPGDRVALKARYLFADREGDGYNGFVTRESYWYAAAQAGTDADNPRFTFSNHPDMRRFDVADRARRQFDLDATWTTGPAFQLTAAVSVRDDDYDSDVRPIQPLAGLALADAAVFTPGDQLGLLDDERRQATLDASYVPSDRLTLTAYVGLEQIDSRQRSLEYNENNKQNPTLVATSELGGWNRAASQWTADTESENLNVGLGFEWVQRPERVTLKADANWTRAETDIVYRGFGVTNFNGAPFADNHQFGFRTPPTLEHDLLSVYAAVDLRLLPACNLVIGYGYERYEVADWQQEPSSPWFESVGSEYLLRDTSRSYQWGNRLINMGSYLAPGFTGHYAQAGLTIRF